MAKAVITGGEEEGPAPPVTHEHPEIMARIQAIESVLDTIEETLLDLQARARDIVGQSAQGAANQIAYFESADTLIGSTALTFDGDDTINAALGPMTIATHGLAAISIDYSVAAPLIAFLGATPIEQPAATDLATLLAALENLGLISAS